MDLTSKIALVTGSSTGIGAAIARRLSENGADVILHGRTLSPELDSVATSIKTNGRKMATLTCDFSDSESIEQFVTESWKLFDGIDILVNNAGGDVLTGDSSEWDFARQLKYLLDIDVVGTSLLSRIVGKKMAERSKIKPDDINYRNQTIINIGWDQAQHGMAGDSGEMFAATKGAVMSLTLSLAQSLAPAVRVNCVAPGWIKTQWGKSAPDNWNKRAIDESLLARWGEPIDVANAVSFLASDQASFINGQVISVNGGFKYFQGN